jgi:tRNA A-37 threonylcarbamoyl transferase component Bud32
MSSAVNNSADSPNATPASGSQLSMPQPQPVPPSDKPPEIPVSPSVGPAQPLHAATPALAGRTLGQYRILEKIGQGGMGSVFKAFDAMLERTVALKVLFSSVLDDAKHSERFLREARSLARLNHPNLVHVYNVGLENECYFFAMELVEGETLSAGIRRRRRIPVHELLPYLGQVLSALHYVHLQGITHRDIKSSNIMLSGKRAVLMDFGLAKDENFTGMTSVGAIVGTPDYMSPEAAEGTTAGPPTDIYSLGVVMYEALCGAVPFIGRSAMSIIRQHLDMPPPPIEAALPTIDPMMASIVHKCLAKKPEDRYVNCASLAADLLRLQNTPELAALAQEQLNETGRTAPRNAVAAAGGSDGPDFDAGAEGTLLDTRAGVQRAMADADGTLAAGDAARRSPHLSANATIVDAERTQVLPEAKGSERGSLAWIWMAAGFFGVFFIAFLVGRMRSHETTPNTAKQGGGISGEQPPISLPYQPAVLRHPDGGREEIRWVEFKGDDPNPSNWYYVIERRQPDGTWKRATVAHRDFIRAGDTLEMTAGNEAGAKK